jgi:hypothetical protein
VKTQDGYDWPTPHPVDPAIFDGGTNEPLPESRCEPATTARPRWKCGTCADTGVIRYQPSLGNDWRGRVERCPVCGPK